MRLLTLLGKECGDDRWAYLISRLTTHALTMAQKSVITVSCATGASFSVSVRHHLPTLADPAGLRPAGCRGLVLPPCNFCNM